MTLISRTNRRIAVTLGALALVALLGRPAAAGPPLVCHPFDIGSARSLPWAGGAWRATSADYDINRLVEDTVALLGDETPVVVRMETIRRAAVYATKDRRIAAALHARLAARARDKNAGALALFDAGYLKEVYKHAHYTVERLSGRQGTAATMGVPESELAGGYDLILQAIRRRGGDPAMEFAAAIVAVDPRRADFAGHVQRALAGAERSPLLEKTLISHSHLLRLRGNTVAELRRQAAQM